MSLRQSCRLLHYMPLWNPHTAATLPKGLRAWIGSRSIMMLNISQMLAGANQENIYNTGKCANYCFEYVTRRQILTRAWMWKIKSRVMLWPDRYNLKNLTSTYIEAALEPFSQSRCLSIHSTAVLGTSISAFEAFTYVTVYQSFALAIISKDKMRSAAKNMFLVRIFIPWIPFLPSRTAKEGSPWKYFWSGYPRIAR
jgi:hypothetical protein